MNKLLYIGFLVLTLGQALGQKNKVERKIVKAVDLGTKDALSLLKTAVNVNSGTMNFEGVKQVGQLFKTELDQLGFVTTLTSGADYGRAGHLIAEISGGKGPSFLLIGHLDTVFETDSPFQQYTMLNDSIMVGPGVSDMKGGDVIIILAMQALKSAGVLDQMNIKIIMTGDEEKSGEPLALSKKDLVDAAKTSDIALGFENADGRFNTAVTSRRGSTDWKLTVSGKASHSSQIFTDNIGVGAIYEASRILNEFYLQLSQFENLTINPGYVIGGTAVSENEEATGGTAFGKSNVVAQNAGVRGDLRAISLDQLDRAKAAMQNIAVANYPMTSADLVIDNEGYPPLAPSPGNTELLEAYGKVSEDLGFGPVLPINPRNAGAADISFTSGYAPKAMDGLGLTGGGKDHTVEEFGNLNHLPRQAKRAALLMYRLYAQTP